MNTIDVNLKILP